MPLSAKVYVIDDDPAMRDSLEFLLGSADFNVRCSNPRRPSSTSLPASKPAVSSRTCGCPASTASKCSVSWVETCNLSGHCHDWSW